MAASAPRVAAPNDAPVSVFRLTAPLPGSQPPSGSPARLMPSMSRARTAVTAGFDYEIVPRYSIAFAPLLTWLALATLGEGSRMARVLAAVSVAAVVALSVTGF